MAARGPSRRGRVRVRGGRKVINSVRGRGADKFKDNNKFLILESDDDGDMGAFEQSDMDTDTGFKTVRRNKKRQRISTGTSTDDLIDEFENSDNDNSFMDLSIDQKLSAMFTKISATEVKVNSIYKENLSQRMNRVENMITTQDARIKLLEYRSIDNEARNRRRNLIFKGIGEYGMIENCFELIQDFITDKLKIPAAMYIERAHRLGRPRPNQTKPRPIIVAFRDFGDTELVLERAPNLRGTQYSVTRDYPKEISDARNALWPQYRKARENPSSKVSIRFPARLVVDGVTIQDMFPDWYKVMNGSRVHNSETNCPQVHTSDQPNGFSNGNGTQQSTDDQATRSLSVHKTNTVNSIVSSDTAGSITDQLRQSTSSEQRQYAGNVNKVSCSASTSRGSSDTVVNQRQREVTSDRTDNSKRVESTGCLNQDANHSNVSANSRDLPPQGNG